MNCKEMWPTYVAKETGGYGLGSHWHKCKHKADKEHEHECMGRVKMNFDYKKYCPEECPVCNGQCGYKVADHQENKSLKHTCTINPRSHVTDGWGPN